MTTILRTCAGAFLAVAVGCSGGSQQAPQTGSATDEPTSSAASPGSRVGSPASAQGTPEPVERSSTPQPTESDPASADAPSKDDIVLVPEYREVTIPAGTVLSIALDSPVASDTSAVEDPVRGHLSKPIKVGSDVVIPEDTAVKGYVTAANRSARVKGRASVAFRLNAITVGDEDVSLRTADVRREAPGTKKEDAKKIGIGGAGGAIIGAIAGGKKGAAIGTAVGAGAGTGVVLATRGDEVRVPAGTVVTTKLLEPVIVRIPLAHQM